MTLYLFLNWFMAFINSYVIIECFCEIFKKVFIDEYSLCKENVSYENNICIGNRINVTRH